MLLFKDSAVSDLSCRAKAQNTRGRSRAARTFWRCSLYGQLAL